MTPDTPPKPKRDWAPHIWEGCDFFAWVKLLAKNRAAVSPSLWYVAAVVSAVSFTHTLLRWLQDSRYARDVRATPVRHPPLFILGHWRSGTTLLHEWLILDPRHNYPNTYQCMEPNHFLLTERFVKRWLGFLMPQRRPMDNMAAGWDRPQEDEFALCMMGQPSPYLKIAFPNRPEPYPGSLDLDGLTPRQLREWKRAFCRFLRTLTFKDPRRLVLKSPPHTCRIPHLLDLFPGAQFVHIVRNPYVIFPSTVKLWKTLYRTHGLQVPRFEGLEEYVFANFERMYAKFEEGRKLIPAGQFHEVRFEDLLADPVGEMEKLYDRLGLGEFEQYRPRLTEHLERTKGYEKNRYDLSPELRAEIGRRWGKVIERYGYQEPDLGMA